VGGRGEERSCRGKEEDQEEERRRRGKQVVRLVGCIRCELEADLVAARMILAGAREEGRLEEHSCRLEVEAS